MRIVHWLRYHIKLLLAAILFYSGALFLVLRRRFRRHGLVLLYHRVLPEAECAQSFSSRAIIVSPATFARHLRFLRRHFTVLGPEEFSDWLQHGRDLARPPCLITFDDGWKDNLTHAVPVLKTQNLPAVIFLPTDYIGTGRIFWQERLSRLLFRLGQRPVFRQQPVVARYGLEELFTVQHSGLAERAGALARSFKGRDTRDIDNLIVELGAVLTGGDDAGNVDCFLSWDDVRAMHADGISFGSHSVSHRIMTQLEPAAVAGELAESKRTLGQRLNAPVHFFAYPNGNHDAGICAQVRQAGYQLAFTTVAGRVARDDDPMSLRRVNIHDGAHRHLPLFCASILGVL